MTVAPLPAWTLPLLLLLLVVCIAMVGTFVFERIESVRQQEWDPYRKSIAAGESAVSANPTDVGALMGLAAEYRSAGLLAQAMETNRRALELDPRHAAAMYNIGSIHWETGNGKAAEVAFWDVLEVDPGDSDAAKALAELYISQGHYRSLLVAVRPAASTHPEDGELQYLQALGDERTGRLSQARDGYWRAMERAPRLVEAREGYERLKRATR